MIYPRKANTWIQNIVKQHQVLNTFLPPIELNEVNDDGTGTSRTLMNIIGSTRTKHVAFMVAGDQWSENYIEELEKLHENNEKIDLILTQYIITNSQGSSSELLNPPRSLVEKIFSSRSIGVYFSNMSINVETLKKILKRGKKQYNMLTLLKHKIAIELSRKKDLAYMKCNSCHAMIQVPSREIARDELIKSIDQFIRKKNMKTREEL